MKQFAQRPAKQQEKIIGIVGTLTEFRTSGNWSTSPQFPYLLPICCDELIAVLRDASGPESVRIRLTRGGIYPTQIIEFELRHHRLILGDSLSNRLEHAGMQCIQILYELLNIGFFRDRTMAWDDDVDVERVEYLSQRLFHLDR